jgi:hypothetical protein
LVLLANSADHAHTDPTGEIAVFALTKSAFAFVTIPQGLTPSSEYFSANPTVSPFPGLDKCLPGYFSLLHLFCHRNAILARLLPFSLYRFSD